MVILKRAFDLVVATLVILGILSWLLPVLAWLIKRDSPGPAFFLQKRVGKGGRLFTCYKLRSMLVNTQADQHPVISDDARITRLGIWLRLYHLDELPQFFNVFLGSMSLVGPRPYMPADCERYSAIVRDTAFRERVKPGITGMAQARGLHGIICDRNTLFQRYHWDAYYVSNRSFGLDMHILWTTFLHLLPRRRRPAAASGSPSAPSDRISVLHLEKRKAQAPYFHPPRQPQ